MSDLISRQAVIEHLKKRLYETAINNNTEHPYYEEMADNRVSVWLEEVPPAQPEQRWIPVKTRPMDEEERAEWSEKLGYDIEYEDAVIYTSQLPDDGQEVLTCSRWGNVRIDKFENDPDYGCSFEENGDMDGIVAWMPLPEPWKGEE